MNIYLKDIDESNWEKCISLTTNKDGQHFLVEEFVASNAVSIAQSKVEKGWITKAVYAEETMVGFAMYGYCYEHNMTKGMGKIVIYNHHYAPSNQFYRKFGAQVAKQEYQMNNKLLIDVFLSDMLSMKKSIEHSLKKYL